MIRGKNGRSARERFFDFADIPSDPDACWQWLGSLKPIGYGKILDGKRQVYAHRLSYEMHVASIPAGMTIDHLCRNPGCVNPRHLEAVTNSENVLRSIPHRRQRPLSDSCPNGHPYTPENTTRTSDGYRRCRRCTTIRRARRAAV